MTEHISASPDQVWNDNKGSHKISPYDETRRGGFTDEQAEDLGFRPPEFFAPVDDTVAPSEATMKHWSEEATEVTVGNETRLYAIGGEGEKFAYVVRKSKNIADDLMKLHEKVVEIRFSKSAPEQEQADGAADLAA